MSSADPTATGGRSRTLEGRAVAVASVLVVAWFLARSRSGADLYDGSHVIALAQRLAQGDRVFADEQNAQALGSIPAVPFVWAWTHMVGQSGIVLASRWFYIAVATVLGWWCYRGLREGLRPAIAFFAVAGSLVVTSYHLLVISYNTVPTLAMVVAVCRGYAALRGPSASMARRLVPVGVALPIAAASLQSLGPACVLTALLVLWLAWRAGGLRGALPAFAAMAAVSVVLLGLAAWVGVGTIREALAYTVRYQAPRSLPAERLRFFTLSWLYELVRPERLAVVLVGLSVAVPRLWRWWRLAALVAVPLLVMGTGLLAVSLNGINLLRYAGSAALYTAIVLLPAAVLVARRDADARLLLLLAAPTAVVGVLSIATTSNAGPWYGQYPPASVALSIATTVAVLRLADDLGGIRWATRVGTSALGALLATQMVTNFYSESPWQLLTPAPSGAYSGLLTGGRELWHLREVQRTTDRWVRPGESLLVYGAVTGAFLTSGARADTNIIWLENFGEQGRYTVDWIERTGRVPDVVLLSTDMIDGDGLEAMMLRDPVLARFRTSHEVVAGREAFSPGQLRSEAGLVVLRRVGAS